MRYLHYVTDQEGAQIESTYSPNLTAKLSMSALAKLKKATYQVWDRETGEIIIL